LGESFKGKFTLVTKTNDQSGNRTAITHGRLRRWGYGGGYGGNIAIINNNNNNMGGWGGSANNNNNNIFR
jgi:hypothetical protein